MRRRGRRAVDSLGQHRSGSEPLLRAAPARPPRGGPRHGRVAPSRGRPRREWSGRCRAGAPLIDGDGDRRTNPPAVLRWRRGTAHHQRQHHRHPRPVAGQSGPAWQRSHGPVRPGGNGHYGRHHAPGSLHRSRGAPRQPTGNVTPSMLTLPQLPTERPVAERLARALARVLSVALAVAAVLTITNGVARAFARAFGGALAVLGLLAGSARAAHAVTASP